MAIMGFGGVHCTAFRMAHEGIRPRRRRRCRDLYRHGPHLPVLYDGRCGNRAGSTAGLEPAGYVAPATLVTTRDVFVYDALKTPQFWLVWLVLCLNVTAGIGVLGQASAMSQELSTTASRQSLHRGWSDRFSRFHGRALFWFFISDYIGRKNTYFVFFALGTALCCRAA